MDHSTTTRRQLISAFIAAVGLSISKTGMSENSPSSGFVSPFGHFFPALYLASEKAQDHSAQGDFTEGLIGMSVPKGRLGFYRLRMQCEALALDQTFDFNQTTIQSPLLFAPKIVWNRRHLGAIRLRLQSEISFELRNQKKAILEQIKIPITIHPANEVLYFVDDGKLNRGTDINWLFAAFVDESNKSVHALIQEAKRSKIVAQFNAYKNGDPMAVHLQVFAIWDALRKRKFVYTPLAKNVRSHPALFSQSIRPLQDALSTARANCADGSVLIASILRALGLRARLVLVPGHMFVSYALDADGKQFAYLETTMMGDQLDLTQLTEIAPDELAFTHFYAAVNEGGQRFEKSKKKFRDHKSPAYQIIDIDAARRIGVRSIIAELSSFG